MTWEEMVVVDPHLATMLAEAKEIDGSDEYFCANRVWFDRFRPRVIATAGWSAERLSLRTSECYDTAYQKIYSVLPPCKNCICL